jgi:hypothetical protein
MDMHEENLSQFSLSAAELLDEFWLALENIGAGEADFAAAQQSLQAVIGLLQRMGELASELDVLQTVFMLLEADLQAVQAEDRTLNAQESGLLQQWLEQLMSYMLGHGEANALDGMISNLENPVWRLPLSSEDIEILKNMYGTSIVSENLSVQESRAQYSMQPQEGVMDEEIVSSVVDNCCR